MRNKQMRVVVPAANIEQVNTVLKEQGLGDSFIHVPIAGKMSALKAKPTHFAIERRMDDHEFQAVRLALGKAGLLKRLDKDHKPLIEASVAEVETVRRGEKVTRKLDVMLGRKGLKKKEIKANVAPNVVPKK